MDLTAANLSHEKACRLTRASMIACFVVASGMLLTSLAMAKGITASQTAHLSPQVATTN
jgi:hypothetical protein